MFKVFVRYTKNSFSKVIARATEMSKCLGLNLLREQLSKGQYLFLVNLPFGAGILFLILAHAVYKM